VIILIVCALIAVNMILLLCAAWIVLYAGLIFLGFGGCRWTSDMTINYYRTVLGIGVSLMTMELIIGIGVQLIQWEIIAALHEAEAFRKTAFIGGTSLRLLRGIGRFSEDLDFSAVDQVVDRSDLEAWAKAIDQRMTGTGIANTEAQIGGTRAVRSVTLRWSEVLKEAGLPSEWCQDAAHWRESLQSKAEKTDWRAVREDVKPFLARPAEAQLLENNTIQTTLHQRRLNPNLERPPEP
jgi:hypothetical protein